MKQKSLLWSVVLTVLFGLSSFGATFQTPAQEAVVNSIQDASYTIHSKGGQGSGVSVIRGGEAYIFTAGHVVAGCRETRQVVDNDGSIKVLVSFEPVTIVKEVYENGQSVGAIELVADIVKYSDSEMGEDIAILKVRKKGMVTTNTVFYLGKETPSVGTTVMHCGSMMGQIGSNSFTTGVVSQLGRMFVGTYFDQIDAMTMPGCSGGGVFLTNGEYMGMLVRGGGPGFSLIIPIRRITAWTHRTNLDFLVDPSLPVHTIGRVEELSESPTAVVEKPTTPAH